MCKFGFRNGDASRKFGIRISEFGEKAKQSFAAKFTTAL